MIASQVSLTNFMGIGKAVFSLKEKGLVLVQGENLDDPSAVSNGSGKSSLADGISWCLTGDTARDGLSADAVVNRIAKKDCEAIIDMEEPNGEIYRVARWRKSSTKAKKNGCSLVHIDISGVETDLTKGTDALTQVEINKALGCTPEVFKAAVYAGQEKLPNLPAMTDKPLKELIEEASGVTTLIDAYEIARKRLQASEREHDIWRMDHVRLESDVNTLQTRLTDLRTRRDGWIKQRDDLATGIKNDLERVLREARNHKNKRDSIDVIRIQAEIDKLDIKINSVHSENDEEARLLNILTDLSSRRITLESRYTRAVQDAKQHKVDLDTIKDKVGAPCNTCGKPYEEHDLSTVSEIAKDKLAVAVSGARELGEDTKMLQEQEKTAKTAVDAYRSSRTDIRATVDERKRLATMLAERNVEDKAMQNSVSIGGRLKKNLDDKLAETNPYVDLVDTGEKELKENLQAHRESEEEGARLEKQVMVRKDVCKVYGPAGVRAHILDTVTPLLNDKTSEYLGTLSDGRITAVWTTLVLDAKGELKEKFAINVTKDGAGGSFSELSGGEKRKVRLACALALQDLVASRATKPIALWIGDEIDDALDDAGLERLMTVLEGKARERGTVLVISHRSLADWIRDVATITMKGGQSVLTGALC